MRPGNAESVRIEDVGIMRVLGITNIFMAKVTPNPLTRDSTVNKQTTDNRINYEADYFIQELTDGTDSHHVFNHVLRMKQ